jgi:hypothetical protein
MPSGQRFLGFLENSRKTFLFVSLFLIVLGSRAAVINYGGNSTPFYDEWDGDAASVLKPYLDGTLRLGDLFAAQNEHVIFFTRLLTLAIFNISGYWDVVLQMIANAILDAATIVGISYALSRALRGGWAPAAMILSVLINAIPLSCDNILLGFETHFYLLPAFSFASLWFLADSRAWSLRWAVGGLCGVASFLCMASGALTLAAAACAHLLQKARGRRPGSPEWFGIAALAAAAIVLASLVPRTANSDAYAAHSSGEFLSAFLTLASWPVPIALGLVVALPSAFFCLRTIVDRPTLGDPRWFNVAAFGWILTQYFALAAGRAGAAVQNRYLDTLLIGLAINLTSVFWLLGSDPIVRNRKIRRNIALAAWATIVGLPLAHEARHLAGFVEYRRDTAAVEAKNVRGYVATGDASYLAGAPGLEIPYPVSSRLRELLDAPEIRAALPPELLSRNKSANWVEAFKWAFLAQGYVWLGGGVLLLVAIIFAAAFAQLQRNVAAVRAHGDPAPP